MGTIWLCLTENAYNLQVPSEVLSYYDKPEDISGAQHISAFSLDENTTWKELSDYLVQQKLSRFARGPVNIDGISAYFVNIEIDNTHVMSNAIRALEAVMPFGYLHSTKQMEKLFGQQYYIGSLSAVNSYNNKVNAHEAAKNPNNGFNFGALSWAAAIENFSDNTEYAILKHPEVEAGDLVLTLFEGKLPSTWFPSPDI